MKPKEIRKNILEILYKNRSAAFVDIPLLKKELPNVSEENLDMEISYLEQKYFLEISGKIRGDLSCEFLNFDALRITADGIDLIEDPEAFGKLFTININQNGNFGKIENSGNMNIAGDNSSQNIVCNDIPPEILEKLKIAIEKKDKKLLMQILDEFEDGAKNVFWNVVASMLVNVNMV